MEGNVNMTDEQLDDLLETLMDAHASNPPEVVDAWVGPYHHTVGDEVVETYAHGSVSMELFGVGFSVECEVDSRGMLQEKASVDFDKMAAAVVKQHGIPLDDAKDLVSTAWCELSPFIDNVAAVLLSEHCQTHKDEQHTAEVASWAKNDDLPCSQTARRRLSYGLDFFN